MHFKLAISSNGSRRPGSPDSRAPSMSKRALQIRAVAKKAKEADKAGFFVFDSKITRTAFELKKRSIFDFIPSSL